MATDEAIAPIKANSDPEVVEATRGFVAGYNRYLRELKSGEHSGRHLACRDAAWLTEITVDDLYRRYFRLSILASSSVFVSEVANAAPPSPDNLPLPVSIPAISALDPSEMPLAGEQPFASNMYALGAEASTDHPTGVLSDACAEAGADEAAGILPDAGAEPADGDAGHVLADSRT